MSLNINLYPKNSNANIENYEHQLRRQDLFGPEKWRKEVWGCQFVQNLGFKILLRLREEDIYVFDDEIDLLYYELDLLLTKLDEFDRNVNYLNFVETFEIKINPTEIQKYDKESIRNRILNALETIRIARKYKSELGVVIW